MVDAAILILLVIIGLGGYTSSRTITGYLDDIGFVLNDLISFFLTLALLFFIWNVIQYFIVQGAQEEGRKKARKYAIWSILGFVFIVSIWGIVNLLVVAGGFGREEAICPDFFRDGYCDSSGDLPASL